MKILYNNEDALSTVNSWIKDARTVREREEALWIASLAVLNNINGISYNANVGILITNTLLNTTDKADNRLLPRYRRQLSDFLMAKMSFSVVPESEDPSDIQAARVGDKVLNSFFTSKRMSKVKTKLGSWIFSCGNCFLEDVWDKSIGPVEVNDKGNLVYKGDVDVKIWSPFEFLKPGIFHDTTELNDLPFVILQRWTSLEEIKFKYDIDASSTVMPAFLSVLNAIRGEYSSLVNRRGAFVYRIYAKPCLEFNKGLFMDFTDEHVISMQEYPFNSFPLEHFKDIDLPGSFWGRSTVSYALGLHERFSLTLESIDEYNEKMGKGRILAPNQCNLTVDMSNEHAEIINYDPILGQGPREMDIKGLPQSFNTIIELSLMGMEDLFSQHEVTRGTNRSDIRSGNMVALLREQDALNNVPSQTLNSDAFASMGKRILEKIQRNYENARILKVMSSDKQWEVIKFKGADLKGYDDVIVSIEPHLADSRLAREERLLEKFRNGLYGDPRDPETRRVVLNLMEDATVEGMFARNRLDEAVSKWENNIILSREVKELTINTFDDDIVHIREHTDVQKEIEFQTLKQSNVELFTELSEVFFDHIRQHQEALQDKIAQASVQGGR